MNKQVPSRLFIFAGEPSGDLHGSHLIKALRKHLPHALLDGVPGPKMRIEKMQGLFSMEDFEVMGFSDVILALPKLYRQFYKIHAHILATKPDAVILIDYPGFNLRMAKKLRQSGYSGKIIHYISPSVWAWGRHRVKDMANTLDALLTIFPFESACFSDTSLNVTYVGNPLSEYINKHPYDDQWRQNLGIAPDCHLTALFPGSRRSEIERNLPIILDATSKLKEQNPQMLFGISCTNPITQAHIESIAKRYPKHLQSALHFIPKQYTYELMRDSRTAIAKSGTVTLELALHQRPTIVIYKLTFLNRCYGKYVLKVNLPHYCIVNILAEKRIFPEIIESGLTPQNLFEKFNRLNSEGEIRSECIQNCRQITSLLGNINASGNAAKAILELFSC